MDNKDWHFMNGGVNSPDALLAPKYFRFSIVRNPFDRFISGWRFCQTKGSAKRSVLDTLLDLPRLPEGEDPYASPPASFQAFEYAHVTRQQHEILCLPDGTLGVDFLMRFENLQADFDQVCSLVGIHRRVLPLSNASVRDGYRSYIGDDSWERRLLERHFERDLELFGYRY